MSENIDFELTKPVALNEPTDNQTPEIKDLERIMKAEVSAVQAYKQVLKKFTTYNQRSDLLSILTDHEQALEFWKTQLRSKEAPLEESAGPWRRVVESFTWSEKLDDDNRATLKFLKEGEVQGLKEYEELHENNKVNFQSMSFIKTICLDQQRKHIAILDGLIGKS